MKTSPPPEHPNTLSYADAGVSIDAGNALVERIKPAAVATRRAGVLGALGGFGGLFDLRAAGYSDPLLVAATDGVGTKLRIAIEADDVSGVGVDLVAMCVNDLLCQGAEPLFFLDYFATGALDVAQAATVVESVAHGCSAAGCALLGGETAEMPGMYAEGDFDLAGFAVGAVDRDALLPKSCAVGDVAIGLPATGPHSNGYSLIRHVVASTGLGWDAPAPFAPDTSLSAALLTPTAIYVATVLPLLKAHPIRALAHITGGGLTENLPRVFAANQSVEIGLNAWTPPPVFRWLATAGGISEAEMLRTFNCGVGLVLFASEDGSRAIIEALGAAGIDAFRLGVVADRAEGADAVTYRGELF